MHLNKNLFYVHRCVTGFYILMLIIAIFLLANYGVKKENLIFSVFVLAIYAGLGALHFRASNEYLKGLNRAKIYHRVLEYYYCLDSRLVQFWVLSF